MFRMSRHRTTISRSIYLSLSPDGEPLVRPFRNPDKIRLMLLACEDKPPYGPPIHTAHMFLDLLSEARILRNNSSSVAHGEEKKEKAEKMEGNDAFSVPINRASDERSICSISVSIYDCKAFDYPETLEEWDSYDGIIISGSYDAAYDDTQSWITHLHNVVRTEVHARRRPTLGVCFGHQVYAHALGVANDDIGGKAQKYPMGTQVGRRPLRMTREGLRLLSSRRAALAVPEDDTKCEGNLLYTHGDMVCDLPSCAVPLGGTSESLPFQAVAYFSDSSSAVKFQNECLSNENEGESAEIPIAITFQAHPEYSSCLHTTSSIQMDKLIDPSKPPPLSNDTFESLLYLLWQKDSITTEEVQKQICDAYKNTSSIKNDSVYIMMKVARTFGWF